MWQININKSINQSLEPAVCGHPNTPQLVGRNKGPAWEINSILLTTGGKILGFASGVNLPVIYGILYFLPRSTYYFQESKIFVKTSGRKNLLSAGVWGKYIILFNNPIDIYICISTCSDTTRLGYITGWIFQSFESRNNINWSFIQSILIILKNLFVTKY